MIRIPIVIFAWLFIIFPVCIVLADSGWTDFVYVDELKATDLHYYLVRLDVNQNPSGCKDKKWFYHDYETPGSDTMFLMLLEALNKGIRVRVYVTGKCNLHGHSEFSSVSMIR